MTYALKWIGYEAPERIEPFFSGSLDFMHVITRLQSLLTNLITCRLPQQRNT